MAPLNGGDASIGGFATNKIGNLADFVLDESTNLNSDYRRVPCTALSEVRAVANDC
jgi:hypothetical protein